MISRFPTLFLRSGRFSASVFLVLLIGIGIFLFKKQRVLSFGIFWFFLTLSVESGFIPIKDLIFEHRTYLLSFGFFLILSSLILGLAESRYRVRGSVIIVIIVIMVIMVIIYSFLTYERNKVWKDDLSLWSDTVRKSPIRPGRTSTGVTLTVPAGNGTRRYLIIPWR